MTKPARRTYASPLREALAQDTRERILEAVAEFVKRRGAEPFTIEAIALKAGIERRTVFRHFSSREVLLDAFWVWINERYFQNALPSSLRELANAPRRVFEEFDAEEGIVRGSLHSDAGRVMRLSALPARQQAFRAAVRELEPAAEPEAVRRFEIIAHAIYSAAAWETMRDYAAVSGKEAGEVASWALTVLARAVQEGAGSPQDL